MYQLAPVRKAIRHSQETPGGTFDCPSQDALQNLLRHQSTDRPDSAHGAEAYQEGGQPGYDHQGRLSACLEAHVCRQLCQERVSTASLKKILGHDRLETTEIYLNICPRDALSEFFAKVEAV